MNKQEVSLYKAGDLFSERKESGNDTLEILSVSIHSGVSSGQLDDDELGKVVKRSEDKSLYKRVYAGDLVFNMMRAWQGAIGTAETDGMVSPAYIVAEPCDKVYPPFMNYYMRTKTMINTINRMSYGLTDFRKRLYWDSFASIEIALPSFEKQVSIAAAMQAVDAVIKNKKDLLRALEKFDAAVKYRAFHQKLLFEGHNFAPWETVHLGDLFDERSERSLGNEELLSVTIANGIIRQSDSEKKLIASADRSNYKRVMKGDLAYNTMRMWQGAVGVLQYDGIISPAYTVLIPKEGVCGDYFVEYFKSKNMLNEFTRYSQGLTSDTWNLKYAQFSKIRVIIPCFEEQLLLSSLFGDLRRRTSLARQELEKWEKYKDGLMQKIV